MYAYANTRQSLRTLKPKPLLEHLVASEQSCATAWKGVGNGYFNKFTVAKRSNGFYLIKNEEYCLGTHATFEEAEEAFYSLIF